VVREHAGCLARLSARQRAVLGLRAGLGDRPARSRRRVSARLDFSVARVARIERRGLRRLRALGREGGCGSAGAPGAAAAADPASSTGASGGAAILSSGVAGTADTSGAGGQGEATGSRSAAGGTRDGSERDAALALVPSAQEQASDWSIAVAVLGVLLFAYALRREFGPSGQSLGRVRR
jgi:hypothetical protein